MFIQTESTPNPATLKFLPGQTVLELGTADFPSADAAAKSPLAKRIFAAGGVTALYYEPDTEILTGSFGGHVVAMEPPNVTLDGPPYRHCDLAGLEAWLMSSLGALSRRHRLEGLVACGHGSAGVLVDAHGPVMPMIDYEQPLPAAIVESYRRQADRFDVRGSAIMHGATHQARQLLCDDRLAIKEVSARLSFSSEFYFSRFFRKKTGMSPRQFRQSIKV